MTLKRKRNSTDDEVCIISFFSLIVDENIEFNLPYHVVVREHATDEDLIGIRRGTA